MMTVPVLKNAIFVGHIGMVFRKDGSLSFPIAEKWRHDLISPEEVLTTVFERISAHNEAWPAGLYHIYVNATGRGTEMAINIYDCGCDPAGPEIVERPVN